MRLSSCRPRSLLQPHLSSFRVVPTLALLSPVMTSVLPSASYQRHLENLCNAVLNQAQRISCTSHTGLNFVRFLGCLRLFLALSKRHRSLSTQVAISSNHERRLTRWRAFPYEFAPPQRVLSDDCHRDAQHPPNPSSLPQTLTFLLPTPGSLPQTLAFLLPPACWPLSSRVVKG